MLWIGLRPLTNIPTNIDKILTFSFLFYKNLYFIFIKFGLLQLNRIISEMGVLISFPVPFLTVKFNWRRTDFFHRSSTSVTFVIFLVKCVLVLQYVATSSTLYTTRIFTVQNVLVNMHHVRSHSERFSVSRMNYVYVFFTVLIINCVYFPIQHWQVGLYNGDGLYFLWGGNWPLSSYTKLFHQWAKHSMSRAMSK